MALVGNKVEKRMRRERGSAGGQDERTGSDVKNQEKAMARRRKMMD